MVDQSPTDVFRRGVRPSPDERRRKVRILLGIKILDDTEVCQLTDPIMGHEHIAGLEVAMDQPTLMDGGQCAAEIHEHGLYTRPSLGVRHATHASNQLVEVGPIHTLHGNIGMPLELTVIEDADHVGVVDAGQCVELTPKPGQSGL